MKKRKNGFITFWVTVMIAGLAPAIAQATATVTTPVGATPQTIPAPTLQTSTTQTTSTVDPDAPSPAKYLTLAELTPLIPGLAINVDSDGKGGQKATLYGAISPDCKNFNVLTSAQGFTIQDKGGFLSCLAKFKSDGHACDDTTVCDKLSQVSSAKGSSVIDCKTSAVVTYLDHVSGDVVPGHEWSASNLSTETCHSAADIAQAKQDAADAAAAKKIAALQQQILSCAKSGDVEDAQGILDNHSFDAATATELQAAIATAQKKLDDKTAAGLIVKVKLAVNKGKLDDFDDLEDQIYAYLDKSPTDGDKMAPLIFAMAQARTTADGADAESISRAEEMMNRALDPDSGITMKASNKKVFEAAVATGGGLDQARLQLAYQDYETVRDKKGECQMTMYGCMPVKATSSAKKRYENLAKTMSKDVLAELKSAGCVDKKGNETDKSDSKECSALEDQAAALNDIPNEMEAAHQEDTAKTQQQAASQQAAMMSGQSRPQYVMGMNGQMVPQQAAMAQGQYSMPLQNFAPQGAYSQVGAPQLAPSMNAGMYTPYSPNMGVQGAGYSGYYTGGAQPMYYHN